MAQAMAQASNGLAQDTQAASFAETGVRVAALAGDDQTAWDLTEFAGAARAGLAVAAGHHRSFKRAVAHSP